MSMSELPASFQGPAAQIADILRKAGATRVVVFGAATKAWQAGDDVQMAVEGLDDDHILQVTGRVMMGTKISADICRIDDPAGDYTKAGGGIEI